MVCLAAGVLPREGDKGRDTRQPERADQAVMRHPIVASDLNTNFQPHFRVAAAGTSHQARLNFHDAHNDI